MAVPATSGATRWPEPWRKSARRIIFAASAIHRRTRASRPPRARSAGTPIACSTWSTPTARSGTRGPHDLRDAHGSRGALRHGRGAGPRRDAGRAIESALSDAAAEIDAALAAAYRLPLAGGPWPRLVGIACDLAGVRSTTTSRPPRSMRGPGGARAALARLAAGEEALLDDSGHPAPRRDSCHARRLGALAHTRQPGGAVMAGQGSSARGGHRGARRRARATGRGAFGPRRHHGSDRPVPGRVHAPTLRARARAGWHALAQERARDCRGQPDAHGYGPPAWLHRPRAHRRRARGGGGDQRPSTPPFTSSAAAPGRGGGSPFPRGPTSVSTSATATRSSHPRPGRRKVGA